MVPMTTETDQNYEAARIIRRSDLIISRTKEILSSGGYDWLKFSAEEKLIALRQAEEEYANVEI